MSVTLSSIQSNYIKNFPAEVPIKAAQGFIVSVAINLVAGAASNMALVAGAIAATATIIEAVTRPIIKAIFPENPKVATVIQVTMSKTIALGLAASVAPWLGVAYKTTSVFIPIIAWLVLNDRFYERNVGMVEVL